LRKPSVDDLFGLKIVSPPSASIHSRSVAFSVGQAFREPRSTNKSAVYCYTIGGNLRRLTSGEWFDRQPALTPEGDLIGFISDRGAKKDAEHSGAGLFVAPVDVGGEVWAAGAPGPVWGFQWMPNRSLVASVLDDEPRHKRERRTQGYDEEEFEDPCRYVSLWVLDPLAQRSKRLTQGVQVWEFSVGVDGKMAALTYSAKPFERSWYRAKLGVLDLSSPTVKPIYDPGFRQVGAPRVSPNSKRILFTCSLWSDRGSQLGDLHLIDMNGANHLNITAKADYSVSWAEWVDDDTAIFLAQRGADSVFFKVEAPQWTPRELRSIRLSVNNLWYPSFTLTSTDPLEAAFSAQYAGQPTELWLAGLDHKHAESKALTSFNSDVKEELEAPTLEPFQWTNDRGAKITGYLEGLENLGGAACPLVVHVHGGPTSSVRPSYLSLGTILASNGYLVFYPNYTGSVGRGLGFAEANRGDLGGQDFRDIMCGVNTVCTKYPVDKNRIYLEGGSYGGYMAMWAATQTTMFAAVAALFGVSDWLSFHGTSNLSDWDEIHLAESPYDYSRYIENSPIRHVRKVVAPVLLLHGREDPYVPLGQSLMFYRALVDLGKKAKLVVYPREGHGFTEKPHVVDAYRRIMDWFSNHRKTS
jgi:prolyl oligopeptidase